MDIGQIVAIDTHTHLNHGVAGDSSSEKLPVYSGKLDWLRKVSQAAGIDRMFCSTFAGVITDKYVYEENEYLADLVQRGDYLYQWVVVDPRAERTFERDLRLFGEKLK